MDGWMDEWMDGWTNEWTNERSIDQLTDLRTNQPTNQQTNQPTNQPTNHLIMHYFSDIPPPSGIENPGYGNNAILNGAVPSATQPQHTVMMAPPPYPGMGAPTSPVSPTSPTSPTWQTGRHPTSPIPHTHPSPLNPSIVWWWRHPLTLEWEHPPLPLQLLHQHRLLHGRQVGNSTPSFP